VALRVVIAIADEVGSRGVSGGNGHVPIRIEIRVTNIERAKHLQSVLRVADVMAVADATTAIELTVVVV
jgi:hypothetical protein